MSLFSGVMRSLVNAGSGGAAANYQVHTPNAVAAVRGTKFDTAYSENVIRPGYQGCEKYTDVSVYQGTVNLAPLGAPNTGEDVHAGYEATLPCDKPPTECGTVVDDRRGIARKRQRGRRQFRGSGAGIERCTGAGMSGMREHDDVSDDGGTGHGGGETW